MSGVRNRFRDLDERWKSASIGRRNACPTYFAKRLISKVGQAVSPAGPMAKINGRHLTSTNSRKRLRPRISGAYGDAWKSALNWFEFL